MALQFYLGRAGAGKTWRCLEDIAGELRRDPSPRAGRLVWLLPEQATAQAERTLLGRPGIAGTMRAAVLSFKRLAGYVAGETGGGLDYLDEQGRRMLLRAILGRQRDALEVFAGSARQAGFIARLAATFTELAQFRHTFDDLEAQERRLCAARRSDTLLARKLRDLVRVGRAWQSETGQRFADPAHFLDSLAERLDRSDFVAGADVWVDGFASFMPQELRVLECILRRARMVRVALLLEPSDLGGLVGRSDALDSTRLFAPTEETWLRLGALAADAGVEVLEPLILPEAGRPGRFASAPALASVEENLARSGMMGGGEAGIAAARIVEGLPLEELPPVICVEAGSPRTEVEAVARTIRRLARDAGDRYRDMAVVVRDMESFQGLIRAAFDRYGIPYFIDLRRPLAHHPLVELLRSSIRAVGNDWPVEDVVHYLKTDFAPVSRPVADRLENRALECGVRGAEWWTGGQTWDEESAEGKESLDVARAGAFAPLAGLGRRLTGALGPEGIAASVFVEALFDFMRALQCDKALRGWSEEARAAGDLDTADEHEQVWDMVVALLSRMAATLGEERLPLDDLSGVLETGLADLALGLVPPSLDQVLVGAVERSRQPELRTVFVLGMNDRMFPRVPSEDVVLTDSERRTLSEECGFELSPPSSERLFRERYLGYVALTRPSHRLWVSWSASDADGRAQRRSPFVDCLLAAAAGCEPGPVWCRVDERWLAAEVDAAESARQVAEGVLRTNGTADVALAAWRGVAAALDHLPEALAIVEMVRARRRAVADVPLDTGGDLGGVISVSRLETYARCPFLYFVKYGLHLRERAEFRIEPIEIGEYHHGILSRVFALLRVECGQDAPPGTPAGIAARALDWGKVDAARVRDALERALDEASSPFPDNSPLHESQRRFYRDRSCRILGEALDALAAQGRLDRFVQIAAELAFGFSDSPLPALSISGGEVRLHGKIDRLDVALDESAGLAFRILDFKSSERGLSLPSVLAGLSLQLPLYVLALTRLFEGAWQPAGMFFLPVRHCVNPGEMPLGSDPDDDAPRLIKMRGAFDLGRLALFEELSGGMSGRTVAVRLKANGEPGWVERGDWMPAAALRALCEGAGERAAALVREIRSGRVAVCPTRMESWTPCSLCAYGDVCRIDARVACYKEVSSRPRAALLEELQSAPGLDFSRG